jgi:ribosomal-protein-serine acetyltransferase
MTLPGTRDGILIRPLAAEDVDALFGTVSSSLSTLSQWLPWAKPGYARSDSATWIAHCQRAWNAASEYHFGVFEADSGRLLGGVGLNHVSAVRRSANLGYWVADDARGGGVAVAAAHLAAAWAFAHLGLQRIEILVQPENSASLRVAVKLGAVCEGIARNGIIVDGEPHEAIVHSLIPGDIASIDLAIPSTLAAY